MSSRPELRLDWCSHEAAKYAVEKWHYSRCMPAGKLAKIGVWESDKFIGVVLYGLGASPPFYVWAQRTLDIKQTEACELVRVALTRHATPVSRIIAISLKMLRALCPKLRCVVSFADCDQGHHGGIYQASGWTFLGTTCKGERCGFMINGKKMHPRSLGAKGYEQSLKGARMIDPRAYEVKTKGKHKYLMGLDQPMRDRLALLAQEFPKRAGSAASGTPDDQSGRDGATPIPALPPA
jgi:hypothetical protein